MKKDCAELIEQREKIEILREELKFQQTKYDALKDKIIQTLRDNDLKSFVSDNVKVIRTEKLNVSVVDEEKFNEYLSKNNLDHLRRVPYQTLQSFYKDEMEKATQFGANDFDIPGVDIKSSFESLQIRKV